VSIGAFIRFLLHSPISRCATALLFILFLNLPIFCGEIHEATKTGDLAKVKAMLKDNPKLVSRKDDYGYTPLYLAVQWGNKEMAELLLANGADINARSGSRSQLGMGADTPLHEAVTNGRKEMVEFLLAHGADVNAEDDFGYTPLHLAAEKGHRDVLEMQLANKAEINAKSIMGITPLDKADWNGRKDIEELLRRHGGANGVAGLYDGGDGVKAPVPVTMAIPPITAAARRECGRGNLDGSVILQVVIRKNGTVTDVKVIKKLSYSLDESAVNTITSKWRFKPGTRNGEPVDVISTIEIIFRDVCGL
jgi:TonB family protein